MTLLNALDTDIPRLNEVDSVNRAQFDNDIRPKGQPIILRGLAKEWPAVKHGESGTSDLVNYLKAMDTGVPAVTFVAPPAVKGRYFYSQDMRGFNFERRQIPFSATLDQLMSQADKSEPLCVYAGATSANDILPSFGADNPMPLVDDVPPLVWIGNSARIAPHFDSSENIACSVAGRRKFLIFPPDQVDNLYVGPLEHNMAGQPASLVDPTAVDLETYPKFETAMESARLAVLEPGDAVYLPALWWHYVESWGPLNVLVNYWWNAAGQGSPMSALALSLLTIRDLPAVDRAAWREIFDHYIFNEDAPDAGAHIPESVRGVIGQASPQRDASIKGFLSQQLQAIFGR